ncbi:uncharacterized protein [Onthophagus taurus]|uniref:uncharacterized protein n=1 Tax=Onthophagus taurus TaxID=166361 RepID=UPI0039BE9309
MKYIYLTLLLTPIIAWRLNNLDCTESKTNLKEACDPSDYTTYIDCVKRQKRDTDCSNDCSQCECEECSYGGCSETCNNCCSSNCDNCDCNQCSNSGCSDNCNSCCHTQQTCQTHYCCYRTCHSACSNSDCRRSCRKSCEDKVDGKSGHQSSSQNTTTHIKTILEVYNEINNTNEIHIPVDVNTTSFNNITVLTSQRGNHGTYYGGDYQRFIQTINQPDITPNTPNPYPNSYPNSFPYSIPYQIPFPQPDSTPCCTIATPRQCVPQQRIPYINCFYQTQRVCNNVCQSNQVIHPYVEEVCDEGINSGCQNEVFYSAQQRPMCAFGRNWPYFGCGVPQYPCSGCYESQFDTSRCPDFCNNYGGM